MNYNELLRHDRRLEKMIIGGVQKKKGTRKPIAKLLRDQVWTKYMGNRTQGKCYCCRIIPIHFQNFEVGHNKSVYSGGTNHINNLRPICRSCNRKMGTKSIEWYRKKFFGKPTKRKRKKTKTIRKKTSNSFFGEMPDLRTPF